MSIESSSNNFAGNFALFTFAAFCNIDSASSNLPWERSQRGDSGIILVQQMKEKHYVKH